MVTGLWHQERYRQQNRFWLSWGQRCEQLPEPLAPPSCSFPQGPWGPLRGEGPSGEPGASSAPQAAWQPDWEHAVTKEMLTAPPQTLSLLPGPQATWWW